MEPFSNLSETNADYQPVEVKKKLEILFRYDASAPLDTCPIRDVLSVASDKWSILIVLFLGGQEVLRFGQLKSLIHGISAKVLTERLRRLERDGYLSKEMFAEVPVRVEYRLTAFGVRYLKKLLVLSEWINDEMGQILQSRHRFDQL